jgi:hypothetical protein
VPVTLKRILLWRKEVENRAGVLAEALEPFAKTKTDLQVVMGYRYPGAENKCAIEIYPVKGDKLTASAQGAGLTASSIPTLLVEGDNKAGLGHAITKAIADAGVNLSFLVAQVIGRRYSAVIGFENEADAEKAGMLIKKATLSKQKR